jgi:hypothetical protein
MVVGPVFVRRCPCGGNGLARGHPHRGVIHSAARGASPGPPKCPIYLRSWASGLGDYRGPVTLVTTLMRPGEGVWQTVDGRITGGDQPEHFAFKQLSVHCPDGTLLVAYTGRAGVRTGGASMSTFDWIRGTLRGVNRTVEGDLLHLLERLNRDYTRARWWEPLTVIVAGVVGSRPDPNQPLQNPRMGRWHLTNRIWPDGPAGRERVRPVFAIYGQVVERPCAWSEGSGIAVRESAHHAELMRRALAQRPNKPLDYLGLLAGVNREAAKRSKGTVSPWCYGQYMPESGQELQSRYFGKRGEYLGPPRGLPSIVFGIDGTDIMRHLETRRINMNKGLPPPPPVDHQLSITPLP